MNEHGKSRHVIVTTDHNKRGVFYGVLADRKSKTELVLTDAKMVIYWSPETHGVLGLAANGPADGSRVSPAVSSIELQGVTAIMDCSEKAIARFAEEIWT